MIQNFTRKVILIAVLHVFLSAGIINAQPPVYMGTGITVEQHKDNWYLMYRLPMTQADTVIPKPPRKGYKLLAVTDGYTNHTCYCDKQTTMQDILKAMVGPEGTSVYITIKKGRNKTYELKRKWIRKAGDGNEFHLSTEEELAYIQQHFPYNYARFSRPVNTDKDSLPDDADACPLYYGPVALNGCPADSDGDGLNDSLDKCPLEFGTAETSGCPSDDLDGDGVPDDEDECMFKSGYKGNACPYEYEAINPKDTDRDGLPDEIDPCPTVWGTQYNKGCRGNATTFFTSTETPKKLFDLLRTMDEKPQNLEGPFIDNIDGYSVYQLKNKLAGLNEAQQYYLTDDDYEPYLMFILYQSHSYKDALNYFSSLAGEIKSWDVDIEDRNWYARYSDLSYEPDIPEEYFEIKEDEVVEVDLGEVETNQIAEFTLHIQIYRYEDKSGMVNEVRLWAEIY